MEDRFRYLKPGCIVTIKLYCLPNFIRCQFLGLEEMGAYTPTRYIFRDLSDTTILMSVTSKEVQIMWFRYDGVWKDRIQKALLKFKKINQEDSFWITMHNYNLDEPNFLELRDPQIQKQILKELIESLKIFEDYNKENQR